MAAEIVVTLEADQDQQEAYDWYEKRQSRLGERFLLAVDDCLRQIAERPELYAKVRGRYRRALVSKFPYAVYYHVEPDRVIVHAIIHTSRHPRRWQRRLP
jgi:plasmid stabilization system protein ParE